MPIYNFSPRGPRADVPMFVAELCKDAVGLPWVARRKHPFFCTRKRGRKFSFWGKTNSNQKHFEERDAICTLQARPSSTATESASVGFSMTLLFWPEKSIATREFSDILLWKKKIINTIFTMKISLKVIFKCLQEICCHSRLWFQKWQQDIKRWKVHIQDKMVL